MTEKKHTALPTTNDAKAALGTGGAMGKSQVPSEENMRPVENLALGLSGKREKEVPRRRSSLGWDGKIHYYIDGAEVTREEYFPPKA